MLAIYLLDSNALGARVIECTQSLLDVTGSIAATIRAAPGTI